MNSKKLLKTVIIPLDEGEYGKGDLVKSKTYPFGMGIAQQGVHGDVHFESQQVLLIDDSKQTIGDMCVYDSADNRVKYVHSEDQSTSFDRKIIASHPHINDTIAICPETMQIIAENNGECAFEAERIRLGGDWAYAQFTTDADDNSYIMVDLVPEDKAGDVGKQSANESGVDKSSNDIESISHTEMMRTKTRFDKNSEVDDLIVVNEKGGYVNVTRQEMDEYLSRPMTKKLLKMVDSDIAKAAQVHVETEYPEYVAKGQLEELFIDGAKFMKARFEKEAIEFAKWKDINGWEFEGIVFRKKTGDDKKPYEYLATYKLYDLWQSTVVSNFGTGIDIQ